MNPDSLMYLALLHCFHPACCMLTTGPKPGLTNRSQISASHVPQWASLELIPASVGCECWVGVRDFTIYFCRYLGLCLYVLTEM